MPEPRSAATDRRKKTIRVEFKRNDIAVLMWALEAVLEDYDEGDPLVEDEQRLHERLDKRLRSFDHVR